MTTIILCIWLNDDKNGRDGVHWLSCMLDELSPRSSEDVEYWSSSTLKRRKMELLVL